MERDRREERAERRGAIFYLYRQKAKRWQSNTDSREGEKERERERKQVHERSKWKIKKQKHNTNTHPDEFTCEKVNCLSVIYEQ